MQIGFSTLACIDWPLDRIADVARKCRYDCVELRGRKGQHVDPEMTADERAHAKSVFDDNAVQISSISAYTRFADESKCPEMIRELKDFIILARDLGAEYVRTFGGPFPEGKTLDDVKQVMADSLRQVAHFAAKYGVKVALETHDDMSLGRDVAEVVKAVNHENVGVLWDVHHPYRHGEAPEETYELLKDHLMYLHVKDAFHSVLSGKQELVLMGAGTVPVEQILRILQQDGWGGPVIVEWEKAWHPEIPDPEVALPQHALKLRQYLGR